MKNERRKLINYCIRHKISFAKKWSVEMFLGIIEDVKISRV